MSSAGIHIGTSGWTYKHWRETFYPAGFPARRWLEYYAERFDTVEINATFYGLPAESTFDTWKQRVPEGFVYAVKATRLITHNKKLLNTADGLEAFLGRVRHLGSRLGPILYQLTPELPLDLGRLRDFIALLPRDLTHVFEFRDPSWFVPPVRELLERESMAFCVHDMRESHCPNWVTARAVYLRFHGPSRAKYTGSYSTETLSCWARRIREYRAGGHVVYAYFNNDIGGHAVRNADELRSLVQDAPNERTGLRLS